MWLSGASFGLALGIVVAVCVMRRYIREAEERAFRAGMRYTLNLDASVDAGLGNMRIRRALGLPEKH